MFQHTKSHGLVSLQFLGVFLRHLSYSTLSGAGNFEFDAISEVVVRISFLIKGSTLLNRDERELEDAQKVKEIIGKTTFVEKLDPFEEEFIYDIFKKSEHKKTEHPYVEPQVQDAQTIETETHAVNDEFSQIKQEFDTVNDVPTEQKIPTDTINLIDGMKIIHFSMFLNGLFSSHQSQLRQFVFFVPFSASLTVSNSCFI